MNPVPVLIPTRGKREQKTLLSFPQAEWGRSVWLVADNPGDNGMPVIVCPQDVGQRISTKRAWIARYARARWPFWGICDDDCRFKRRVGKKLVACSGRETYQYLMRLMAADAAVGVAGGALPAFAQDLPFVARNISHRLACFLFRSEAVNPTWFEECAVFEDVNAVLAVRRAGWSVVSCPGYPVDKQAFNKTGGNADDPQFAQPGLFTKALREFVAVNRDCCALVESPVRRRASYRATAALRISLARVPAAPKPIVQPPEPQHA